MKTYKILFPVLASAMLLTGCDDQIMQWGTPDGHAGVTSSEIPLAVKEALANYDNIKDYSQKYMPNTLLGIGMGVPMYVANEKGEGDLANANYQLFTAGNAMKHDAVVAPNGTLNFGTVDALVEQLQSADMKLYGHNFFWHTQQQQNYLKSLVAPEMVVVSDGAIENIVTNSDFEDGTVNGYQGFWCDYTYEIASPGHNSDKCLHITTGKPKNMWDAQLFWGVDGLKEGVTYAYSFYAKSDCNLEMQFIGSQSESPYSGFYKDRFNAGSDWTHCQGEFTYDGNPANIGRVGIQFGGVAGANLWIDDFEFGKKKEGGSVSAAKRATSISYNLKSAEEKRKALEGAMESWVKGMAEHLAKMKITPYGYDVINEPIADGGGVRGYDGVFGGSWQDGDATYYDAEPVESTTDGLSLNWGPGHWYWGYYVPDYPVRAFRLARKYLPAETKLFVNDYNLETNPEKLRQLCDFVKKIDTDNGSPIVDGIGTQMHIYLTCSDDKTKNAENIAALKDKVDAMFKTMAATGKLVRVTELDIAIGTSSPSSAQYQAQADCYRMIVESFKANVPEAQQSGITIWSLSDNEAEHEFWLKGDVPNLFDADYLRKWAYKGFCDGIAGEDLGLKFGGDQYKAFYEKNNVSGTVK